MIVHSPRRAQAELALGALQVDGPVCGVDEAGRGPLAGPVYAAAVVLDPRRQIRGLRDSKQLDAPRRETLSLRIRERARAWAIASASVEEIDELNILQASLLAMQRAVAALGVAPVLARIDGDRAPKLACAVQTIVGGDASDRAISAASILAKVARDEAMCALHERFPQYGFDRHKGYGTPEHLRLLQRNGPCGAHRRSFAPVRMLLASPGDGTTLESFRAGLFAVGADVPSDDD
ncbi:MAG: ribonuclease HII [Burkholderiaceae bacterium]|nr:ribonuclease HII [Burkholderiaceae bacterium]